MDRKLDIIDRNINKVPNNTEDDTKKKDNNNIALKFPEWSLKPQEIPVIRVKRHG